MVLLQFYSSICSGREPLRIGGTGMPSCRSVNRAKALKETPSSDLNQEKSTQQPQPFLIHCRTPEERSVVPFTPALWHPYRVITLQTEKIPGLFLTFPDEIATTNAHLLIQNLRPTKFRSHFGNWLKPTQNAEHQICKNNYSTNKVQVSYMMFWALVTVVTVCPWHQSFVNSILLGCHSQISLTTKIPGRFPDFMLFHDPVSYTHLTLPTILRV